MLAKLGDFLKPAQASRDSSQRTDADARKKRPQGENPETAPFEDVVLLSISAIRALVKEEVSLAPRAPDLLRQLAILEQHGLQSLPVMAGQPVADAITTAASFLSSAR